MAQLNTQQQATNVKKHIHTENRPMSGTETDTRPSDDDESPSPVVDPDAKVLSEVQEEFVKPYINWSPVKLKLNQIVTTITEHTCCWRTDDDSKIILGGEGCLTVLRDNGVEKVYKLLNIDLRVISGLSITSEKQLICVEDLYSNAKEVHTVNIPQCIPDDTELHCVNTLDIMDPVCLFVFDKLHYGVLCENSSIECYSLKNILLDHEPAVTDVIKLDIDISGMDTACATPDGNVVVTSYGNRSIYVYNVNGDLLNTLSPSNTWTLEDDWHQIYWDGEQHRLFVQCFVDGVILASDNRVICTLKEETCFREEAGDNVTSMTNISYCVSSERRIWFINGDERNEVHIYTCDKESTTPARTGRRNKCQTIAIIEPKSGLCPREVIYSKTIETKKEYNCCWGSGDDDQIFLGGRDTITQLRNDETMKKYNLWDHNLDVISGLAVTRATQLICVKDRRGSTTTHVIDLPEDIEDGTQLLSLTKLIVSDPIYIFPVNKMRYGLLCGSTRIALFTLRDILRDQELSTEYEINIDHTISNQDTACATPDEKYCITSWVDPALSIFNETGDLLYRHDLNAVIGSNIEEWIRIFLDGQCHCLFVQCVGDGIVLASDDGVVCSLKSGCWKAVNVKNRNSVEHIGPIRNFVMSNGNIWCIGVKNNIQIYNVTTSQLPIQNLENTMLHSSRQEFTKHHLERGPTTLEYDKTIVLRNQHSCSWRSNIDEEIFLGGQNTITVLRDEDEGMRERVYKLWNKNLILISGHAVTNVLQLLCCRENNNDSYMCTVNAYENLIDGTQLQPISKLNITNPVCAFSLNSISYGAICKTKRLQFFTVKSILFGKLWFGSIHNLNHDISETDRVCSSQDMKIYVTSTQNSCVYIYKSNGQLVQQMSIPDKPCNEASHRLFVQCFKNNIFVASEHGFISTHLDTNPQSYVSRRTRYDKSLRQLERMHYCTFNETSLWIIDKDNTQIVHISKC